MNHDLSVLSKKSGLALLMALAAAVSLVGCAGSSSSSSPSSGDDRMIWSNTPVMAASLGAASVTLTLSGTLLPPTVNGTTITADDIFVGATNTYVSYNLPGDTHAGGIDQLLLSVLSLPVRVFSTTFTGSTVNGVYQTGSNVYAVGSTSNTLASGWSAYVSALTVGLTGFSTPTTTTGLLNTYAGTAVTMWNGSLYALSGANGSSTTQGLQVLNPTTLAQTAYVNIVDARGFATYTGTSTTTTTDLFVVAGGGNVYDINSSNAIAHTIAVGGNTIAESKSSIQVGKTMVAVTKGDAGAAIICQADQHILATLPAVGAISGLTAAQTVTNGIAAGSGLLFVANGDAGLYVYTMTTSAPSGSSCNAITLTQIGTVSLGSTTYSANTVRYTNGVLYLATGLGGFRIIIPVITGIITNASTDFN